MKTDIDLMDELERKKRTPLELAEEELTALEAERLAKGDDSEATANRVRALQLKIDRLRSPTLDKRGGPHPGPEKRGGPVPQSKTAFVPPIPQSNNDLHSIGSLLTRYVNLRQNLRDIEQDILRRLEEQGHTMFVYEGRIWQVDSEGLHDHDVIFID